MWRSFASISVKGGGSIRRTLSQELKQAQSLDTDPHHLLPTTKDLKRRTSLPPDAQDFNIRFPCLVNRTRVLEACIWFWWESIPDFVNNTSWENFPMSLSKTPPYPQHKPSVRDMSIGSENRMIFLTLWCLLLICYLLFVSSLLFNKMYISTIFIYMYNISWRNDLNQLL